MLRLYIDIAMQVLEVNGTGIVDYTKELYLVSISATAKVVDDYKIALDAYYRMLSSRVPGWGPLEAFSAGEQPDYRPPKFTHSHCFQPFLSIVEKMRYFPAQVVDVNEARSAPNNLKYDPLTFIRNSSFAIEKACACFYLHTCDELVIDMYCSFCVKHLYENFHQLVCMKEFSSELMKATFAVLLFRFWYTLRQRNDVLKLLKCQTNEDDFGDLVAWFTGRYIPAPLCQLESAAQPNVSDLCTFQKELTSKAEAVAMDRDARVQYFHKMVKVVQKFPVEFQTIFDNADGKAVVDKLSQLQDEDFSASELLEAHSEQIYHNMACLSKREIDILFDSIKIDMRANPLD